MSKDFETKINEAIQFLTMHGYIVSKDYSFLIGKWVTFRQAGMKELLHGQIKKISWDGLCTIRCKNGNKRYEKVEKLIGIYSFKQECYNQK